MPGWSAAVDRMRELGIDCSYRQLDYWCRLGYLGEHVTGNRPGWRREFTVTDLEVLYAVASIRRLSQRIDVVAATDVVRVRPVAVDGEVLVIDGDGRSQRFTHWCGIPGELAAPVVVVPLRSFAASVSPTDGERPVPVSSAMPPVPANHATTTQASAS